MKTLSLEDRMGTPWGAFGWQWEIWSAFTMAITSFLLLNHPWEGTSMTSYVDPITPRPIKGVLPDLYNLIRYTSGGARNQRYVHTSAALLQSPLLYRLPLRQ